MLHKAKNRAKSVGKQGYNADIGKIIADLWIA